jgi:nucleotide-binding universal stress UspA family protein
VQTKRPVSRSSRSGSASQRAGRRTPATPGFRRIVIPTDLTERTAKAFDLALRLAQSPQAQVTLLHVVETIRGLGFDELRAFYGRLEKRSREKMAALARRSAATGVRVAQAVVYGARAEEIVKFAAAHRADLIVLASHRVKPIMVGRDWGTISYKVGLLAQCPVLLVK